LPAYVAFSTKYNASHPQLGFSQQATNAKNAFRTLCGNSQEATGPLTVDRVALPIIAKLASMVGGKWGADGKTSDSPITGNDAMVAFHSCRGSVPASEFKFDPKAKRYVGHINHGSGTARDGDIGSDPKKRPMAFLVESVIAFGVNKGLLPLGYPNMNGSRAAAAPPPVPPHSAKKPGSGGKPKK